MRIFVPAFGRVNTQNRDGGAVRFFELAKRWQENGIELEILTSEREIVLMKKEGVRANYISLPEWIRSERDTLWNVFLIYSIRILQSFIYKFDASVDVIYSPSDFIADVISGVLAKRKNPNTKLIVCIFLIAPNPFTGYRNVWKKGWRVPTVRGVCFYILQKISICLCRKYADKVFVLNNLDKKYLEGVISNKEISTVDMGISLNEVSKMDSNKDIFYDGIFIGRIHQQKGIEDLIKAWKVVCDEKHDAKLGIVGGGDKLALRRLNNEIKFLGCENNIKVLGFRTGSDKFSLLKSSRVFLMPSYYESWGLVILEAMSCGLPVIAYRLPVYKEKISGGMVTVEIGNINNFAESILEVLKDNILYKKLSAEAINVAGQYNWDLIARDEIDLINN